ncbi:aspartate kinase [Mariniblastus sp.]|nr:aspartate kinase [Mariniblastus sp.]MDB4671349.1 aspartate kinase [Pirellulaceae bacterium]MDB4756916.1 aspartate kinase [Mariniblastus sp.]
MSLIVQKFGGTSVADTDKIKAAARKAVRAHQNGHQVVMVVSAMGKNTDMLVGMAHEVCEKPKAREMDMLLSTGEQVSVALMAMAIHSLGFKAVSLTGGQIGIKTDSTHTKARIESISTERMKRLLDDGNIVIAAGFQGIDDGLNITTLGRGGSDTTAVALAAVLQADACEIYTDVDGVFTTDPRVLPEARKTHQVRYDEMLELASLGAGVMHSRSIEFAKKFDVPIHVRSSLSDSPGSLIWDQSEAPDRPVTGAAVTRDEARISLINIPDKPGVSYELFSNIANAHVTVDMIVQNAALDGNANISFTVPKDELPVTLDAVKETLDGFGQGTITSCDNVSKISVVGTGMAQQTGVANMMFESLVEANINMEMITTSEIKISALISRDDMLNALRAVHDRFDLHSKPTTVKTLDLDHFTHQRSADALEVVARLQGVGMEALFIDDINLDESQASVAVFGVPNRQGIAALIFDRIAAAGIFVDMIVQSYPIEQEAVIGFTVPKSDLDRAIEVTEAVAMELGCQKVTSRRDIDKLSVSGIGLRSHTGVAIGMFKALSNAGINIQIMNTSEVRVNVIVDGEDGGRALKCLRAAFAEAIH